MNKLLTLFVRMQTCGANFIAPDSYTSQFGEKAGIESFDDATPEEANAFINDILYALDGPEQREAQAHASFDYIALASRTMVDDNFNGDMATSMAVREVFDHVINAGNRADVLKKALFYRRGNPVGLTNAPQPVLADKIIDHMTAQSLLENGLGDAEFEIQLRRRAIVILHCVLGVVTEAAEMAEALRAAMFANKPIDAVNMMEESGDLKWYLANLARILGFDWDTDERYNIDKLKARFPDKFNNHDANNRDLAAERAILEGNKPGAETRQLRDLKTLETQMTAERAASVGKTEREHTQFEGMRDSLGIPTEDAKSVPNETEIRARKALNAAEHPLPRLDE